MAKTDPKKTYAIIMDGKVQSIVKGTELPEYNDQQLLVVEAKKDTAPGDEYVNGKFKAFDRVEEARKIKIGDVQAQTLKMITERVLTFKGHTYPMGGQPYEVIVRLAAFFSVNQRLPEGFFMVDVKHERVAMTNEEFKEFIAQVFNQVWADYTTHAGNMSKVSRATTLQELEELSFA